MGGEDESGCEAERPALERASMNGEAPAVGEPSRDPSQEGDRGGPRTLET